MGAHIPSVLKSNKDFGGSKFYSVEKSRIAGDNETIISKFQDITGIAARRYASPSLQTSDIAAEAGLEAIIRAEVDKEKVDQIIMAHNFGNIRTGTIQSTMVPSIGAQVKHALEIANPACIPYDLVFGCPGWLQGLVHADAFIKASVAEKCLVIGAEMLSRVVDVHDRDSMIFADGAGAGMVELREETEKRGILSTATVAHSQEELNYLSIGCSYLPDADENIRYIKMQGRKIYEYALTYVPQAMKNCLDKSGVDIKDVKKVFLHQANEKMDDAILKRFYKLYDDAEPPEGVMPMNIYEYGNSSVATIPTLYYLVTNGMLDQHKVGPGDVVLFASVGAGMNVNAITYRI